MFVDAYVWRVYDGHIDNAVTKGMRMQILFDTYAKAILYILDHGNILTQEPVKTLIWGDYGWSEGWYVVV